MLFSLDDDNTPQPQMVEDWTVSDDAKTWTFTLRDGLQFHDGSPVTSEEVVLSIARFNKKDKLGKLMDLVTDKWEQIDAKTFSVTLTEPFGPMLETLGKPTSIQLVIMPKDMASLPVDEGGTSTIGSGPYEFVEWKPGDTISFARYDGYSSRTDAPSGYTGGKRVYVDEMEWKHIPDAITKVAALETGQVDYIDTAPPDLYDRLNSNSDIQVLKDRTAGWNFLFFNKLVPPFDDARARRAVQMLTDQVTYLRAGYPDVLTFTCKAVFGCGQRWETDIGADEAGVVESHVAEAKALWDQVGYDEPIDLILSTTFTHLNAAGLVTQRLMQRDLGVEVRLNAMEGTKRGFLIRDKDATARGEWQMGHLWSLNYLDPINQPCTRTELGYSGYVIHPRLEQLKLDYIKAASDAELQQIVEEFQKVFYEQAECVNLGQSTTLKAYRAELKGVIGAPSRNLPILWNIWLDR
jgi:peptide/nickel transport system substrate-binding protein